jgi:hypothetical protein
MDFSASVSIFMGPRNPRKDTEKLLAGVIIYVDSVAKILVTIEIKKH